ncbi:VOC family protein [Corynebacterium sp. YIM 101645]|uniref:VOC family protein n=1 Tax=Corynebacterium lemuris TaxID=1859292 RepID=A0ABT2FWT0_9CORY|nr:VOC family protein [Corynebacterium lemuris]MCS5479700.1 VOC family protein [Corynebacterium lemuris]
MTMQFSPNISFPGNATEALRFYHEVFGGELDIMTYDDMPDMELPFEPPAGAVAHATLSSGTVYLAGGDAMGPDAPDLTSDVYSFLLQFDKVAEARDYIVRLTAGGGKVTMAFEKAPWGDYYGQVTDQFGVVWMFNAADD